MASFPRTEPDIAQLASSVISGMKEKAELFPAPPVPVDELEAAYEDYRSTMVAAQRAQAEATERYAEKAEALGKLVKLLKRDLRYAEISVEHEEQLGALGWGGRRRRTPLAVPGQVLGIQIIEEGEGWIALRWRKPVAGGKPAAYKVQVRRRQGGAWEEAGMTVQRKLLVQNQPRGVDLEYRVIAVNRAGDGKESGLVAAVL